VEAIMSTPLKKEDRVDDPLSRLTRSVHQSPPVAAEPSTSAATPPAVPEITNSPPMAPGVGGPNLDLPPLSLRSFEGSAAAEALASGWQLGPDLVLRPPTGATGRTAAVRRKKRLAFVVILSAIVAVPSAALFIFLNEGRKQTGSGGMITPLVEGLSRTGTPAQPPRLTIAPQLVITPQKGFANEPLPLGVSLGHVSGRETVTLAGLAAGTILSVGTPLGYTGWQMSARDIGNAVVHAPKDFVGIMDAAIDLHSASDRLLDSRFIRLEWTPKKAAPSTSRPEPSAPSPAIQTTLDPEQTDLVRHFLKNGDVASARILLKRAATAGNAEAALELGMTFDPVFLADRGILGSASDVAQARAWYQQAMKLGSTEASRRLERLASMAK
jgi:hypothetical protein